MTITCEQVKDLQPGDVVEVVHEDWPAGTVVRGPLWLESDTLMVGRVVVRHWDGRHPFDTGLTLTVVSRAPRPLYVNHPRTEPVPGDVVRDADGDGERTWALYHDRTWMTVVRGLAVDRGHLPARLRLLVDGETGRCVQ